MERADKIFTILVMAGLVAILVMQYRRHPKLPHVRLNESATDQVRRGPAYLLSALPIQRPNDDTLPVVSQWPAMGDDYDAN